VYFVQQDGYCRLRDKEVVGVFVRFVRRFGSAIGLKWLQKQKKRNWFY
jgi:hypothetical protein